MIKHLILIAALALFGAVSSAIAQENRDIYFPVVVNGHIQPPIHLQTMIRIVNQSDETVRAVFEAFQNDGTPTQLLGFSPVPLPGTETVFEIPARGAIEAFTAGDVPSFNGWARLTIDSDVQIHAAAEVALIDAQVGPHPICLRPSSEILADSSVESVDSGNYASAFAVNRSHRQTAAAIVNPSGDEKAVVYLSLLDLSGNLVASGKLDIAPLNRVSRPLSELLPGAPPELMGVLWIQSDTPVAFSAVHVLFPEGKYATAPVSVQNLACSDVLSPARNPLTGECETFPNGCTPVGWTPLQSCEP